MKGKYKFGAQGSFVDVIRTTNRGQVKWRLRYQVWTCVRPYSASSYRCVWLVATTGEVRLLVKAFGKWERWSVPTTSDERCRLRSAIILGGLEEK